MDEVIIDLLTSAAEHIDSIGNQNVHIGSIASLLGNNVYNFVCSIIEIAIKPTALMILALFMLLELQKIVSRVESSGGGNMMLVQQIFSIIIRYVFFLMLISCTQLIHKLIFDLSTMLSSEINSVAVVIEKPVPIVQTVKTIAEFSTRDRPDFFYRVVLVLVSLLAYLLAFFASLLVKGILVLRNIELFVLMALSPIPISMLPGEQTHGISVAYFKKYASVCMQGVVISFVTKLFPVIMKSMFDSTTLGPINKTIELTKLVLGISGMVVVLVMSVLTSAKWAKSLFGMA